MSLSTWLSNGKVTFSIVRPENKNLLVCTSNVGSHKVIFVENLETGKRVFPTESQYINSGKEMDDIVLQLAEQL